jgi:hypothetical protein
MAKLQLTESSVNALAGQTHNLKTSEWSASSFGHIEQDTWQTPRDSFYMHVESESLIWGHQLNRDFKTLRLLCDNIRVNCRCVNPEELRMGIELAQRTEDVTIERRGSKSEAGLQRRPGTRRRETGVRDCGVAPSGLLSACQFCFHKESTRPGFIWISYTTFNSSEVTSQGTAGLFKKFSILGFIKICAATS